MRPWINEIKKIFVAHGVPTKFIYLAIAESHFKINAVSNAQAVGPYQITEATSQLKEFKIIVNSAYDERLDPLKSAELCAKHLRLSYEKLGKNWDLALLDYNGAFTNEFLKSIPRYFLTSLRLSVLPKAMEKAGYLSGSNLQYPTRFRKVSANSS